MIVFNHFQNDSRVLKEAYTLIENGYKVKVFALHKAELPVNETIDLLEIERIPIKPVHERIFKKPKLNANVAPPKPTNNNTSTATPQKVTNNFFKRVLLSIHKIITYIDFYNKVIKKIRKESFDIYHSHDLNTLYPAYKGAKFNKGKLVYDSHELYIERNKPFKPTKFYKYISSIFERYLIRKTNVVITVGEFIADYLKNKYKIERPTVIMNSPSLVKSELKECDLRKELNVPPNLKIAIYSGSITFNRGLVKMIESLTLLPDIFLILMGPGKSDYKEYLNEVAKKHNIHMRLAFFGPVPSNKVTCYTASADLGIAPIQNACLSYYYCAPNKVFEYLIGGIPVVASNFPELSKIVSENEIGYTFDPEDTNSISNSVKKIFSDENEYLKMKDNTHKASQKYNWENESKKLLALYNSL